MLPRDSRAPARSLLVVSCALRGLSAEGKGFVDVVRTARKPKESRARASLPLAVLRRPYKPCAVSRCCGGTTGPRAVFLAGALSPRCRRGAALGRCLFDGALDRMCPSVGAPSVSFWWTARIFLALLWSHYGSRWRSLVGGLSLAVARWRSLVGGDPGRVSL